MSTRTAPEQKYLDLVANLAYRAPGASATRDLPELTLADLGAVLQRYPGALIEAVADFEPTGSLYIAQTLPDPGKTLTQTYSLIGMALVAALRRYVLPLVLKDVQARIERNREVDAIEAPPSHYAALTDDQVVAQELGLGRSLS